MTNERVWQPAAEFLSGSVWLAGAGPGDAGLLTLLAHYALKNADVILHDALISPSILALAGKGAKLEYAGKPYRGKKVSQDAIIARMIELARAGKKVLRLKGGDPCVFARGGEEAEALTQADVPFRMIPAVTAGIAALEYAGLPPTHRQVNHAITFITGHAAGEEEGNLINWQGIADGAPVLVFYMAGARLAEIAAKLLAAGRQPDEPVTIISAATTPDQKIRSISLAQAAASTIQPPSPAIIAVGAHKKWQ